MGFTSKLSALFRPILSVLGMTTRPTYEEFISEGASVQHWYDYVKSLCASSNVARGHYTDRTSLPVRMIRRYKEVSLSQHEYLVAEISPKCSSPIYVQLERLSSPDSADLNPTPASHSDHQADPASRPSLSSVNSASISNSSESSSKKSRANDHVKIIQGWPAAEKRSKESAEPNFDSTRKKKKDRTIMIEEVSFRNLTLHDLIIVSRALHDNSPVYELFKYQCYWFSNLIVRILVDCDPTSRQTSLDAAVEAEVWKEEVLRYKPQLSGRWWGIAIHDVKKKGLDELTKLYIEQSEEFRSNVCFDFINYFTMLTS